MSDILVINTDTNQTKIVNHDPLNVYDDKNPLLDRVMPEFSFLNPDIDPAELISRLKMTMKLYNGLGLAANQCGIPARCFVIQDHDKIIGCFNPRIVSSSEEKQEMVEGCLSFPGIGLKITRPTYLLVEFQDQTGQMFQAELKGISARCFQHELDHLNGIKFTSYVGKTKLLMAKKKQSKLFKKHSRGS